METIKANNLTHSYISETSQYHSLENITFSINQGEFIAVLGQNGCGKTTLARHLNALIPPQQGELTIAGLDARAKANLWKIRQISGMVFQNPEHQFVSTVVEEDLAFGLRNFGFPEAEIRPRIQKALEIVGLPGFEKGSTHFLSGGQKQRIAIAGVLAVEPDILIFDEATAMLDPEGRKEVQETIEKLHRAGKTILVITHYIEEAISADRIFFLHAGKIIGNGTPREVLTDPDLLYKAGLTPPMAVRAYYDLKAQGIYLPTCPLTKEELVEALCQLH